MPLPSHLTFVKVNKKLRDKAKRKAKKRHMTMQRVIHEALLEGLKRV